MNRSKWTFAGLLTTFVIVGVCQVDEGGETSVWVGVKVDNENYDACVVYTQPQNTPKDLLCESVETLVNGGYEITTVSDDVTNNTRHIIQHHCDRGYELVGHSNRTCNGTSKQWTNEEPHCEPHYVSQFKQKWETTQDKVNDIDNKISNNFNKLNDIEKKTTTTVSAVADQLTAYANTLKDIDNRITTSLAGIDDKLNSLETKQAIVDNQLTTINTLLTSLNDSISSVKDHLLKEGKLTLVGLGGHPGTAFFEFYLENTIEAIFKAIGNESYYIESQPFYSVEPGYRVKLLLYPNDDNNSGHVGLYLELVQGNYDDDLSWPSRISFELAIFSRNGNRMTKFDKNPGDKLCPKAVFRKPPNNVGRCGTATLIKRETLLSNKDEYLTDGSLKIEIKLRYPYSRA